MMEIDQRAKWGWLWVALFVGVAYLLRTLYDIQGLEFPQPWGGILTFVIVGVFAVQLLTTLIYEAGRSK